MGVERGVSEERRAWSDFVAPDRGSRDRPRPRPTLYAFVPTAKDLTLEEGNGTAEGRRGRAARKRPPSLAVLRRRLSQARTVPKPARRRLPARPNWLCSLTRDVGVRGDVEQTADHVDSGRPAPS